MYQNLVEEKNIVKQAETRLMEENKSLINQQKGRNTLLTNLQTIQVSLISRHRWHGHIVHVNVVAPFSRQLFILIACRFFGRK